jgi:hypothetical protein
MIRCLMKHSYYSSTEWLKVPWDKVQIVKESRCVKEQNIKNFPCFYKRAAGNSKKLGLLLAGLFILNFQQKLVKVQQVFEFENNHEKDEDVDIQTKIEI